MAAQAGPGIDAGVFEALKQVLDPGVVSRAQLNVA
jgi:hypothetical protein